MATAVTAEPVQPPSKSLAPPADKDEDEGDDGEAAGEGDVKKKKKKKKAKKDDEPAPAPTKKKGATGISALKAMMEEKKRIEEEARRKEEEERRRIEEEERRAEEEARRKEEEKQRKKEKEKVRRHPYVHHCSLTHHLRLSASRRRRRGDSLPRSKRKSNVLRRYASKPYLHQVHKLRDCSNPPPLQNDQCMVIARRLELLRAARLHPNLCPRLLSRRLQRNLRLSPYSHLNLNLNPLLWEKLRKTYQTIGMHPTRRRLHRLRM
jgi:hypothetical protein